MYSITNLFILALIAVFVIFRLFSSFGKYENDDLASKNDIGLKTIEPIEVKQSNNEIAEDIAALEKLDDKYVAELESIMKLEASFTPAGFLKKASSVFEYILDLYCQQKIEELKELVSPEVLTSFTKQIKELQKSNSMVKIVIISISDTHFTDVQINGKKATIKVAFESHQIEYKTDQSGNIISGNSSNIFKKSDFWTFSKELGNKNPNWTLVAT